jgi:Caspase domain
VAGTRNALIVASYDYADQGLRQLHAPASDARALEAVLRDPGIGGFDVRTLLNAPTHEVNLAVEEFFADRRPDDLLLVHFSCHGVKDEGGDLYFATSNTMLRRLGATAVGADFVNRCISRSRSRRIVLLLDCCYAGAFERGMTARAGTEVGIEAQLGGRGRAVITASSAMEYAFEGEELADVGEPAPSVFTSALVKGLETGEADRDQDGLVALDELYDYIYDMVRAITPNQTPGKWMFGVQGEMVIARRSRPVTTPAELPRELQEAIGSPLAAVRAAAVQEVTRLLTGRHAGLALGARLALERLTNDDSRTVANAAAAALGSQTQSPAAVTAPPGDLSAAPAPADRAFAAPPEDLLAEALSTLPASEAPAAPAEARPADTETEAPVPTAELMSAQAEAELSVPAIEPAPPDMEAEVPGPASEAPADTESEVLSPTVTAGRGSETLRPTDLISAGSHSRAPGVLADLSRLAAGVLAITAAILAVAGLSAIYQTLGDGTSSYRLADYSWTTWSVVLGAVVDLIAGACLVIPRTRRFIGPGILLGYVAVSSGGLALLVVSVLAYSGYGSGFWLEFASSLAEVAAACLVAIAVARTGEIRWSRWPGRAGLTWIIVLMGAAAAVALAFHAHNLSAAARDLYLTTSIWTAVMAVVVPVCATAVAPSRFAVALLGGWLAADVTFLVYHFLFLGYERDQGYAVISTVPLIVFGLALVALAPAAVLFARGAPSAGAGTSPG